jgi:LysM repeat protein
VAGAPDAAHRCAAGETLTTIERDYQARFCLTGRHETCERYVAHVAEHGPLGPSWRAAAPDATFASTRLVMDTAPRTVIGRRPNRLGALLVGVVLVVLLIAWLALGGLAPILGPPDASASPSVAASPSVTSEPSVSAEPSASGSASAAPTPTPPGPTPTPAPTPVTYIVQAGDTLNAIAARYGTTAQAIMAANGLTSEIIQVGQVLIIPIP